MHFLFVTKANGLSHDVIEIEKDVFYIVTCTQLMPLPGTSEFVPASAEYFDRTIEELCKHHKKIVAAKETNIQMAFVLAPACPQILRKAVGRAIRDLKLPARAYEASMYPFKDPVVPELLRERHDTADGKGLVLRLDE